MKVNKIQMVCAPNLVGVIKRGLEQRGRGRVWKQTEGRDPPYGSFRAIKAIVSFVQKRQ